jgi:hypothetical protein
MSDVFRKQYRELHADETATIELIKQQADALYETLTSLSPSRESSTAKTRLEESVMWAVKHVTG